MVPLDILMDKMTKEDVVKRLPLSHVFDRTGSVITLCSTADLRGKLHAVEKLCKAMAGPLIIAHMNRVFNQRYHNTSKDDKLKSFTFGTQDFVVKDVTSFAAYIKWVPVMTPQILTWCDLLCSAWNVGEVQQVPGRNGETHPCSDWMGLQPYLIDEWGKTKTEP